MFVPVFAALFLSAIELSNGVNVEIPDDLYTAGDSGCIACRLLDLLCGGPPKPTVPPLPPFKCTVDALAYGWTDTTGRTGYLKVNGVTALDTTYTSSMTDPKQWSRGINLGVLNIDFQGRTCSVSNLKNFDLWGTAGTAQGVADYINALPAKTLLVAVTDDTPTVLPSGIPSPASTALSGVGFNYANAAYGSKFAFVSEIGQPGKIAQGNKPLGTSLHFVVDITQDASSGDFDFDVTTNV